MLQPSQSLPFPTYCSLLHRGSFRCRAGETRRSQDLSASPSGTPLISMDFAAQCGLRRSSTISGDALDDTSGPVVMIKYTISEMAILSDGDFVDIEDVCDNSGCYLQGFLHVSSSSQITLIQNKCENRSSNSGVCFLHPFDGAADAPIQRDLGCILDISLSPVWVSICSSRLLYNIMSGIEADQ